jgi:hypothetical protein
MTANKLDLALNFIDAPRKSFMATCSVAAIRILEGDKTEIPLTFVAQGGDIALGKIELARNISYFGTELINSDGDVGNESIPRYELHGGSGLRKSEITPLERTPDEHGQFHTNGLPLT